MHSERKYSMQHRKYNFNIWRYLVIILVLQVATGLLIRIEPGRSGLNVMYTHRMSKNLTLSIDCCFNIIRDRRMKLFLFKRIKFVCQILNIDTKAESKSSTICVNMLQRIWIKLHNQINRSHG